MSDLLGCRFDRWTVICNADKKHGQKVYLCRCDCGNEKEVYATSLKQGKSKSCGCLQKELRTTHGKTGTKTFNVWYGMIRRCTDKNHHNYEKYKDRGVSDEWLDFDVFLSDMGEVPEGMTLDRIDNEKGYSKENCRWATTDQQARNRKDNINITFKGVTKTVSEFAREYKINPTTLHQRISKYGWSLERALGITSSKGIK
jgi:hypothetical protein